MREIKFIAWDREEKVMIDADSFYFSDEFEPFVHAVKNARLQFDIMEFTGFKSKNGQEIYEDYILSVYFDEAGSPIPTGFKGIVKMIDGCWCVDNGEMAFPLYQEIAEWKIIGNIYKNPDKL